MGFLAGSRDFTGRCSRIPAPTSATAYPCGPMRALDTALASALGCCPKLPSEQPYEAPARLIAEGGRHVLYLEPLLKQFQRANEPDACPPLPERHPCLLEEEATEIAGTCPSELPPDGQCPPVGRVLFQRPGDALEASVPWLEGPGRRRDYLTHVGGSIVMTAG